MAIKGECVRANMFQSGKVRSSESEAMTMRCLKSSEAAQLSYPDIALQLEVDIHTGLSEYEVGRRRMNHGYNEFDITADEPLWKKYLGQACFTVIPLIACGLDVRLIIWVMQLATFAFCLLICWCAFLIVF